jgi:hypothetical protein
MRLQGREKAILMVVLMRRLKAQNSKRSKRLVRLILLKMITLLKDP